jgi:threonine dehydratase
LGFEILEQLPQVTCVVIPIGGGGLVAGVAAVLKQLRPAIRIIGVQAEASAAVYHSLKAGKMVTVPDLPSIADGIAGNIDLNTITFPMIQKYVDDVVLVSETEIASSMRRLLLSEKLLVEGSAAAAYAALEHSKVDMREPVVAIMTGGNTDLTPHFPAAPK